MPEYRHPLAGDGPGYPPARVHISRAENATVAEDGTFEAPKAVGQSVAARFDMDEADLRVDDSDYSDGSPPWGDAEPGDAICTCGPGDGCDACGGKCPIIKSDGDVCGRERPCPYHGEEGGDE